MPCTANDLIAYLPRCFRIVIPAEGARRPSKKTSAAPKLKPSPNTVKPQSDNGLARDVCQRGTVTWPRQLTRASDATCQNALVHNNLGWLHDRIRGELPWSRVVAGSCSCCMVELEHLQT